MQSAASVQSKLHDTRNKTSEARTDVDRAGQKAWNDRLQAKCTPPSTFWHKRPARPPLQRLKHVRCGLRCPQS